MPVQDSDPHRVVGETDRPGPRNRWVWRLRRDQERQMYFLATLALIAWYLVSRVL